MAPGAMLLLLSALVALSATASAQPQLVSMAGGFVSVDPATHMLVDQAGRERFFHGVNAVFKGPPWHPRVDAFDPRLSLSAEDSAFLQSIGLNVVRLGAMWPGLEPERGSINATYLAVLQEIVAQLAANGVYTLLDFHQDNLADEFCGEGLPSWVVNASGAPGFPVPIERAPYPVNASTGFPSPDDCARHPWAVYQFSAAQCRAYQNLYDNAGGAADALGGFWATLAGAFNASTSVLGYELMNEPWVGDLFAKPQLIVPGHADRENLAPFYERLHAAIRTQDAQHIVMFEAITFDDFVPVGFQAVPGGDAYRNRSALSFHYYDAPNLNRVLDFSTRKRDIARLGCGGMLTEFGTCADSDAATDLAAIARTCDFADAALLSWAGWEYKSFVEITGFCNGLFFANGSVNTPLATTLARPYAKAVAGRTLVMAFNATTREFTLRYAARNDSTLPTVVALNGELVYPGGAFAVEFDPDPAACQLVPPQPPFAPEPWHFVVLCGPQLRDGDEIGLRVSPKE